MSNDNQDTQDIDLSALAQELGVEPEVATQITDMSLEQLIDECDKFLLDPELSDEHVAVYEPALESLRNIVDSVGATGTISRADARVMQEMSVSMEGFAGVFDNMPLNSFTELPSKINFEPSMENMITAFIKRILELIKAGIARLRDLFKTKGIKEAKNAMVATKVESELDKRIKKVDLNVESKIKDIAPERTWKTTNALLDTAIKGNNITDIIMAYQPFITTALTNTDGSLALVLDANRKVAAMFNVEWSVIAKDEMGGWTAATQQMIDIIVHLRKLRETPVTYTILAMPGKLRLMENMAGQIKRYSAAKAYATWKKTWDKFVTEQRDYNQQYNQAQLSLDETKAKELLDIIDGRVKISNVMNNISTLTQYMSAVKLEVARIIDTLDRSIAEMTE